MHTVKPEVYLDSGKRGIMTLLFKPKQTIEFIGDSITDCDRRTMEHAPLGWGYVREIHRLLQAGYPELQLTSLNMGISGNRITNLAARWQSDVINVAPDWLFIYIGVNDVWRYFEGDSKEAVDLPEFTQTYRLLIDDTRSRLPKTQIRLVSPFLAEKDHDDPFRLRLGEYQVSIDDLGEAFNLPVTHLQPAFDWAMLSKPTTYWTVDRVHPTPEGHMLLSLTILRTCGYIL
ncbi:MAG: SGNH/GDSL hydrolase family protein [Chloroflexota bacterium]|nr:SGNH/GDSL hydrolase family protein [Chloroflexota bacterium]